MSNVSVLPVVLAAAAYFIAGAVWYSDPVFGGTAARHSPLSAVAAQRKERQEAGGKNALSVKYYIVFTINFIQALAVCHIIANLGGLLSVIDAASLASVLWAGISLPTLAVQYMFAGKAWQTLAVDAGYSYLGVIIFIQVQALTNL